MALLSRSQYLANLATLPAAPPADWTCDICLRSETESAPVYAHNGLHLYHTACLMAWLEKASTTCPGCRQELFKPDPIPTAATLAAQPAIERDSKHLHGIWGWDQYSDLIQAEDLVPEDGELIVDELHKSLQKLRQRWLFYTRGDLIMNVAYPDDTPARPPLSNVLDTLDEETEPGMKVDSTRLITALFATFWAAFSRRQIASVHHPLATGLLLHAIDSIKRWNGWNKTGNELRMLLRINLETGFDTLWPVRQYMRPLGWEWYKNEMIGYLVRIFEEEDEELEGFVGKALPWQEQHEELWRN